MQAQMDPQALARQIAAAFPNIDSSVVLKEPIIIVSAPRSGSNLLFEQLAGIPGFWTIGGESHAIFRAFPHLRAENPQFDSGSLGETHADAETAHLMRSCFLYLLRDARGRPYLDLPSGQMPSSICLLEKTPRNALNIPFLLKVFPDARFVYLHRQPRPAVASLIEAWTLGLQSGRFKTFQQLPDWDRPGWCFLLPPGWREMRGKSLAEIAAFQWSASNRIIIEELASLPMERWTSVTYESLVADPQSVLTDICRFAKLDPGQLQVRSGALPLSRTTITPPSADKWRKYETEIERLYPSLADSTRLIERFCSANIEEDQPG
ncbi:MAG: zinc chelation protein SecC [Gammaproteobacteria bacterium]|nr:MAG: zinc chelation protein SecC [Gammaproteobacteria bacterium]